jgi:hypothetical protein
MGSSHSLKRKRKKLFSCVFFDDVLCSFRKSERSGIMNRCSKCPHYERFVEEMGREEEEFWREVDEVRDKEFRCHFDGKLCDNHPVGACFGVEADSGDLIVCPRFDVNRLADDSLMKKEFLRLRGGGSVEC